MEETAIEWCARFNRDGRIIGQGRTWNPWRGCADALLPDGTPHPGCANCYARRQSGINPKSLGTWGTDPEDGATRILAAAQTFNRPLAWNKRAAEEGNVDMVFVDSMSDFADEWSGPVTDHDGAATGMSLDDVRAAVLALIDRCQSLRFLIFTKRPWRLCEILGATYRSNVWLCYSASDQASYDAGAEIMVGLRSIAPVCGISFEPALSPIDFGPWLGPAGINWIIAGGESGNSPRTVRALHPSIPRSVRRQCQAAGIPWFLKQWGEWLPISQDEGAGIDVDKFEGHTATVRHDGAMFGAGETIRFCCSDCRTEDVLWVGKKAAGSLLDGVDYKEFPSLGI
jgi:protein gp37